VIGLLFIELLAGIIAGVSPSVVPILPASVPLGYYGVGGTWGSASEGTTAVRDAQLNLGYQAQHVYLVLGGRGTVRVLLNGVCSKTITVQGFPTLYTLLSQSRDATGHMTLPVSAGVSAYDFTFG
jgi:hypothetical protein